MSDVAEILGSADPNPTYLKELEGVDSATKPVQSSSTEAEVLSLGHLKSDTGEEDHLTPSNEEFSAMLDDLTQSLGQIKISVTNASETPDEGTVLLFLAEHLMTQFGTSGNLEEINQAIGCFSRAVSLALDDDLNKPGMLSKLGSSLWMRSEHSGNLADTNKAIACHSKAASLTPDDHLDKPAMLGKLYNLHMSLFRHLGNLADIDRAIIYLSHAMSLIPDDYANRADWLDNLGISHISRFEHTGALSDADMAIDCLSQSVSLTPDGDEAKPGRFSNLGTAHMRRSQHVGAIADIDQATVYYSLAVSLVPDEHAGKPSWLSNLGSAYLLQFEHIGDMKYVDKAIACISQGVSLTPDGHAGKPNRLSNLGNSYMYRFEHLGDLADIDKAIALHSEAVILTPDGRLDKPDWLNSLGSSHTRRFQHSGDLADVDKAIKCQSQAVSLTPDGHADKPEMLSNLGISYLSRSRHVGDLADLNKSITCHSQAVSLTPDDHAGKSNRLNNLGNSHMRRFQHLGHLVDIDKAIECLSQAVSRNSDTHTDRPGRLNNLGTSHALRFEQLGDHTDIDRAITLQSQSILLTPDGHADKPGRFSNLGFSHMRRFEHIGDQVDIETAITLQSQAVFLTPEGHADRPARLNNLGNSHKRRFEHTGELADIDQAIASLFQAVSLTAEVHADRPARLSNLGNCHQSRFQHLKDLADIDKAITYLTEAVSLIPDGHANKSDVLDSLGNGYQTRFEHQGDPSDIHKSISFFQLAAHCPTGGSLTRFKASRKWAELSVQFTPSSSLSAYQWTMDMVPKVVWIGSTVGHRYDDTRSIGDVATQAAALAISVHEYGLALEWLEAGRSIVWNQMLQLRTQSDDLSIVDPTLATNLGNTAVALEHASSRTSYTAAPIDDAYTLETVAQQHHRLAEQYEDLLNQARQIPGFHDFMRPKKTNGLLPAARSGPVVVVNVHASRCDALIIRPHTDEISHVPLPDVSVTEAVKLQPQMKGYNSRGMTERGFRITLSQSKDSLESLLSTLWHNIAKPVLASLGYDEKLPMYQLPHITWCTTSALAMLPIHAAGCYDETKNNLFSYAISSYAPTLSSLLSLDSRPHKLGAILAVSQEATLPATKQELACIKRHAGDVLYRQLENHEATAEAVLSAMKQFNSVHFACHASQNLSQPLESCFHLHDRGLSLADIMKGSLKDKGLAFLSACQTATGDEESPDEAIHLAAGMLFAGYPSVIATMWSIMDSDAPVVADHVYGQLINDGKLDNGRVARALHVAVSVLRDQVGEKEFVRWVPYIYMGI